MFEAFVHGGLALFTAAALSGVLFGTVIGIIIGIIPAIGGMVGVSLFLPMVYVLSPETGLTLLIGIEATVCTGGALTSILTRIPGTPVNVASTLDGYPMVQKGEGARAIGAALTSSLFGAIASVAMALLMIPAIVPLVMGMKSPEMFLLILLGLSFLSMLSTGGAQIKGLIAGFLGILVALIGLQYSTGVYRYTFGIFYLFDGINIVPMALGTFAMAEVFNLFLKGSAAIAPPEAKRLGIHDLFQGVKDVFHHWWLWLRCTVIGYIIGIVPAVGAAQAIFIAYAHAKQSSKHPEEFGKGTVEGVIAPEAANHSSVAGDFLTTLAFGIPGSPVMCLLLGAFLIVGITPGPKMLTEQLPLSFMLILSIALANIIAVAICFLAAPSLAKITRVPFIYLFPIISVVVMAASVAATGHIVDVVVIILLGVFGLCMMRFGFSMACFILGYIMGGLLEHYLWLSLKVHGLIFFTSPISIGFVVIIVAIFCYQPLKSALGKRLGRGIKKA